MSHYTLLTGATGLVGRYLVRDLLSRGYRLAVLVRSSKNETAEERVESILQMWEQQSDMLLPRPVCLEGDVNQPGLGLKPSDREWVAEALESTGARRQTEAIAREFTEKAQRALGDAPPSPFKEAMLGLTDFALLRTS